MQQPVLKKIILSNARGITYKEFDFINNQETIVGENGRGKSTIKESYFWCMTGKDSRGDLGNAMKTQDEDGKDIHHTDAVVTCFFELDGKEKNFSRCYKEDWVGDKKCPEKDFKGHTIVYEVDGLDKTKGKYEKAIEEFFGVSIEELRILSDINFFAMSLDKKKRRTYIAGLIPEVTYQTVIDANPKYDSLTIGDSDPFEYKAHCTKQKKSINEKISIVIPSMIKGIDELVSGISSIPFKLHEENSEKKSAEVEKLMREKANFSISDAVKDHETSYNEKRNDVKVLLKDLDSDIRESKKGIENAKLNDSLELRNALSIVNDDIRGLNREIELLDRTHGDNSKKIESLQSNSKDLEAKTASLRVEMKNLGERTFAFTQEQYENDNTCGSCGRSCSCNSDTYEETHSKLKATFEKGIEVEKLKVREAGKANNVIVASNTEAIGVLVAQNEKLMSDMMNPKSLELESKKSEKTLIEEQVSAINEKQYPEFEDKILKSNELIEGYEASLEDLHKEFNIELTNIQNSSDEERKNEIELKIIELKKEITEHNEQVAKKGTIKVQAEKRKEYEAQIIDLTKKWEEFNIQEMLAKDLVTDYTSAIEDPISDRFTKTSVKLFEPLIGVEGLKETCEMLDNGVELPKTNTAQQINCGIDIRNTFAKEFNCNPPVFVDSAECVSIPEQSINEGQMIFLEKVKGSELKLK